VVIFFEILRNVRQPYAQNASSGFALLITLTRPGKVTRPPRERPRGGGGSHRKLSARDPGDLHSPCDHFVPTRPPFTTFLRIRILHRGKIPAFSHKIRICIWGVAWVQPFFRSPNHRFQRSGNSREKHPLTDEVISGFRYLLVIPGHCRTRHFVPMLPPRSSVITTTKDLSDPFILLPQASCGRGTPPGRNRIAGSITRS
jgi:hypothetical protein